MAAMVSRRPPEPRVFFPWERKRGLLGVFGRRRARAIVASVIALVAVVAIYDRSEQAAAVRSTRATLTTVVGSIQAYRADHAGACPRGLSDVVAQGYLRGEQLDAWGRPLRFECPGRVDPLGFDLSSDGADGLPGGLDQVR
jgi:general secretion pathway protein G